MAKEAARRKTKPTGLGNEGPAGATSKSGAVRRAPAYGADQPVDGVADILSQFGIAKGTQHFFAVKSAHLMKQGVPTFDTRFQKAETPEANGGPDGVVAIEASKR